MRCSALTSLKTSNCVISDQDGQFFLTWKWLRHGPFHFIKNKYIWGWHLFSSHENILICTLFYKKKIMNIETFSTVWANFISMSCKRKVMLFLNVRLSRFPRLYIISMINFLFDDYFIFKNFEFDYGFENILGCFGSHRDCDVIWHDWCTRVVCLFSVKVEVEQWYLKGLWQWRKL